MLAPLVFLSFAGQYGLLTGWKPADFGPVKKWYCKKGSKSAKTATLDTNTSIAQIFATYESRRMCANKQIGRGENSRVLSVREFFRDQAPTSFAEINSSSITQWIDIMWLMKMGLTPSFEERNGNGTGCNVESILRIKG